MRIVKRLTHVLVLVLTLVIGAAAAAAIVSQTAWFKNWLRGYIVSQANLYLNGTLSIERLGGNLFFGIEMENIGVSMDGSQVVAVKDLGLDYSVFQLLSKGLSVDSIRLDRPVIYLRREGDTWSLSRLVKKQETEADRRGPAYPIAVDAIGIANGSVVVDSPVATSGVQVPKRFDHLDAKLSFKYEPVRYSIEISHVSFRGSEPALAVNAVSGGLAVKEDTVFVEKLALRTAESSVSVDGAVQQYLSTPILNLEISSDKLSLPEIARLLPALSGVKLQPSFNVKADGPLDSLKVEMNVQSSAGQLSGTVTANVAATADAKSGQPLFARGEVSVKHLDLSPILNNPRQKSDITANARFDLQSRSLSNVDTLHGTASIDSPRAVAAGYVAERIHAKARVDGRRVTLDGNASAYGAAATVAGNVSLPEGKAPLGFDVHGVAQDVDLKRLPRQAGVPPASTNVNAAYHVTGSVAKSHGDLRFESSTVAGAKIAAGSTAAFAVNGPPSPAAARSGSGPSTSSGPSRSSSRDGEAGKNVSYSLDATVADLDLQRLGNEFSIPALAVDRYKSTINGHIVGEGRGTTPQAMDLTAAGTLTDTSILGGRIPQLSFDATLARDTMHVKANGTFADVDPAVASGKPELAGTVAGSIDVNATVTGISTGVTPDSVQADANVALQPSTIGGLDVTQASVDGSYHNATGDIRVLDVVGRDVNVHATGTLALNDTGQSNLKVHADTPSLEQVGRLVNQPLAGIAKIDATVTGNKRQLQATGNLTGDGVKYGDNGALTLSSDFTATIPELTAADANVTANTHATFVTVSGQNINELDAKTTYHQKQLDFDATAKQPQRALAANGSLLVHPDHQEIHLEKLDLTSQGVRWQTAPNSAAAVRYFPDAIEVKNLELLNGDQQISAAGTLGQPGDALQVALKNIDVASVDALLLRPPQLSGRLTATGTVSGTKDAPQVKADFQVALGGFRDFHYDSFNGTVDYAGKGLTVDARLQQNATTYLTAKGYVPVAVFTAASTEVRAAAHGVEVAAADRIDLHVESTPIDLGLVQGLTTALTNVKGTLQANVDITGSAADPHPNGTVSVANASFTVPETGVNYTNLQGRIDLLPDKVHIDNLSVLDNHQSALSITGDLAVHEKQLGALLLNITARDFKVIDNKMGNVRINSDVQLGGELQSPRVEGEVGIETGSINVDEILAQTTDSAYATRQTEYLTKPEEAVKTQPATPSPFDALKMDVHLTVPDDLVVKASSLQTPDAPIGLGSMNVTLGGDVRATKQPGAPIVLVGAVNTVRGTYDFQGRRFDILRDGTIRFDGEPLNEMDPVLDIRARRVISGVEARVNVRGSVKQPDIVLASTPPLEQADILSLIVFNQPVNQLGAGDQISLVQRAQSLAGGALTGQLAQSIGDALGVNTFEINLAPETGGGPQVTLGQQVGQNLFVKLQQSIGDQSQTNFIVEYELAKWLRLQTNVIQGSTTQQQLFQRMQGSGVDLLFFFSY
jgi:autotransporter translocation and assembly factor TamB